MSKTSEKPALSLRDHDIVPVNDFILVRHDEAEKVTTGGILLPDSAKIETLTAIIVALPESFSDDMLGQPYDVLDRIVYDIRSRVPVKLDGSNDYWLTPVKSVIAVIKKKETD